METVEAVGKQVAHVIELAQPPSLFLTSTKARLKWRRQRGRGREWFGSSFSWSQAVRITDEKSETTGPLPSVSPCASKRCADHRCCSPPGCFACGSRVCSTVLGLNKTLLCCRVPTHWARLLCVGLCSWCHGCFACAVSPHTLPLLVPLPQVLSTRPTSPRTDFGKGQPRTKSAAEMRAEERE
jgi:hypothetical protein